MGILVAVLSGFVLAAFSPWISRMVGKSAGWLLALLPLGIAIYFGSFAPSVMAGEYGRASFGWVPGLDIYLSFYVDGLSMLFALLISGIGTFIVIYAGGYLKGHLHLGRFYAFILMFMASMLGLVLSDNLITLFVFWELTSFSSYLLIGFNHEREESRAAALQALLVTGGGGLALLAGLVMMGIVGGAWEISALAGQAGLIQGHALYVPILILVLAGAFTKSAQFPFHFWLPGAMEAPTPVSAYLHSATMVKAGIYLMARLNPVLGGTDLWMYTLVSFGAVTMFIGAWLALQHTDLKRILAYLTVMALGTLTMLIGMGTVRALEAAVVFIVAHSLYKGALFMVAGTIDHEAGTRDVTRLSGLRGVMPITTAIALVAGFSAAGFPPLFGFIGKDLVYAAALDFEPAPLLLTAITVAGYVAVVGAALIVAIRPFFGAARDEYRKVHEAPLSMWIGPAILATLGLILGVVPALIEPALVTPTAFAIGAVPVEIYLTLWHGFNLALGLSVLTMACGVALFLGWDRYRPTPLMRGYGSLFGDGPVRGYQHSLNGLNWFAAWQTRVIQTGVMSNYLLVIILTTLVAVSYTFFSRVTPALELDFTGVHYFEWILAALIVVSAVIVTQATSRLTALITLGVIGFSIAIIFIIYGAPDVAMTQLLIETLTVILVALVLFHLPSMGALKRSPLHLRDALIAAGIGGIMSLLILTILSTPFDLTLSEYFAGASYPLAHGRNIVNVILVDFRGLDTMGEIVVLGVAGLGIYALVKLNLVKQKPKEHVAVISRTGEKV